MTDPNHLLKDETRKNLRWGWLLPALFKPRPTLEEITSENKPVWLTPLLVLSILVILSVLVAAPIRRNALQMGMTIPEDFQYYSEEQQTQFLNAQASQTSPLFLYVFPTLTGLASLWISWFILSSTLNLSLSLSGSRASSVRAYNLAGWSFLPIGVRYLVRILAMLFSKTLIASPGLSGFISTDASGFAAFFSAFLGLVDFFFIWQVVLLLIGVVSLSGLVRSKAWTATFISVLILMLLQTVPGFLSHVLSGLSLTSGFYF